MIQDVKDISDPEMDRRNDEKSFWDKFSGKYDLFMNKSKPVYELLIKKICRYIGPSKKVLEIATGTGMIALGIAQNAGKVYGFDISYKMIEIAEHKRIASGLDNIEFAVRDAYNLGCKKELFDVVIAVNALHIMISPEKALKSVYKVLKPDGFS